MESPCGEFAVSNAIYGKNDEDVPRTVETSINSIELHRIVKHRTGKPVIGKTSIYKENEMSLLNASGKSKILFLCTGNSCRSHMAEGWTRHLLPDEFDVYSAGIEPKPLDPQAVTVMKEVGIDISGHRSKHVRDLMNIGFDFVVTVCDGANEMCPIFPGKATVIHKGFEDPPRLAENTATEEEALQHYRRIRDEIHAFVEKLPDIRKK